MGCPHLIKMYNKNKVGVNIRYGTEKWEIGRNIIISLWFLKTVRKSNSIDIFLAHASFYEIKFFLVSTFNFILSATVWRKHKNRIEDQEDITFRLAYVQSVDGQLKNCLQYTKPWYKIGCEGISFEDCTSYCRWVSSREHAARNGPKKRKSESA